METTTKHTPGAIRAAEIITGYEYGSQAGFITMRGRKTVEGIADLIDRETAAPELLRIVKGLREWVYETGDLPKGSSLMPDSDDETYTQAIRAAIAKATGATP